MSLRSTNEKHEALYQDLAATLKRHADKLSSAELLAVTANMVGKIIAMQDQRRVSPALAMAIVAKNIEEGNRQALALVQSPDGSA